MAITTIATTQAPDAKPVAKSFTLTTNWQTMIEAPNYEVPELVFGGSTTGDLLELKCDTNLAVHATLSFTLGQSEEDDV